MVNSKEVVTLQNMYRKEYTNSDGQIESVVLEYPCTEEDINPPATQTKYLKKRWGLDVSVSQVDDAIVKKIIELSGIGPCQPSGVDIYLNVRNKTVTSETLKKLEKVIDLTIPRPKVTKPSILTFQDLGAPSQTESEKVIELKPRRPGQPPAVDVKRPSKACSED